MKKSEELSFEEAMNNLEDIVAKLEKGELSLDESVENFKKGIINQALLIFLKNS